MCKLVPMTFPTGVTANVADIKVEKLKKYLEIFPKLKSFDKVYDRSRRSVYSNILYCYDSDRGCFSDYTHVYL